MKKLSENFKDLSDHVADTKQKVADAEKQTKEKVETTIKKSKDAAKARQASFTTKVKEAKVVPVAQWDEVQENFHQKTQQIKNKIGTDKEAREVKKANKQADDAEEYAGAAIMFAYMAIDEAEVAVLEAIAARAYADTLA